MSQTTTEPSILSWRRSSNTDLQQCEESFEERFVVRSLQNFPPRPSKQQQQAVTRRKSTGCVCRRCSRSSSPAHRRSEPGQQLFEHLISKGRKPERLLVPDLATEWFRKQKVFLDKVTPREKRALRQNNPMDESFISLPFSCESSRSKLQHSVQYLDYCQELRRRKLLLRRQRQQQRNGDPVCRCTDPPKWPPGKKKIELTEQEKAARLEKKRKLEKRKLKQQSNHEEHAKAERNPITVCAAKMSGCMPETLLDKPTNVRTSGGCSCQSRTDPCLYPHRICSCQERVRRRNSCACIFQADGQPMAEECLAALRKKSSLPRLRKKYNLREVPQRRLDPGCFRRISPEFYSLLKSYEDGITEKYPLYGTPVRYWGRMVPCCPCETPLIEPCVEPCLGDQSLIIETNRPNDETEPEVGSEHLRMDDESMDCDGCENIDCTNLQCESKPNNDSFCNKESCEQQECVNDCDHESSSDEESCNDRTCTNRRKDRVSTNISCVTYDFPLEKPELSNNAPNSSTENTGQSRHLRRFRSGFSYQPQPYKPPISKQRKQSIDSGEVIDVVEPRMPQAKRKGVLGSFAGLCKRAFSPGRYLLYNFSAGIQRQAQAHQKINAVTPISRQIEHSLYSAQPNEPKASPEAHSDTGKHNRSVGKSSVVGSAQMTAQADYKPTPDSGATSSLYTGDAGVLVGQSADKYGRRNYRNTVEPAIREDDDIVNPAGNNKSDISDEYFKRKSNVRNDQRMNNSGGRNEPYMSKTAERDGYYAANSDGRSEQLNNNSNGIYDQYTDDTSRSNVQYKEDFDGRNEPTSAHSSVEKDQESNRNEGFDQFAASSSFRSNQPETYSGVKHTIPIVSYPGVRENSPTSPETDSAMTITPFSADSGVTSDHFDGTFDDRYDSYATESSFIDNLTMSDSAVTIIQVLANPGVKGSQTTAKSEEEDETYTERETINNTDATGSEGTFASGLTANTVISTVGEGHKLKESPVKIPRDNCRRSFKPISDYQQVMRLMGRRRTKLQSKKRCTVTFADLKRQKIPSTDTSRKHIPTSERPRNNVLQSANSIGQVLTPRQHSLMPGMEMRGSIHNNPQSPTYEYQHGNHLKKNKNRVQCADQDLEQEMTPTVRYSDESFGTSEREWRAHSDEEYMNEESPDSEDAPPYQPMKQEGQTSHSEANSTSYTSQIRLHERYPLSSNSKISQFSHSSRKMEPNTMHSDINQQYTERPLKISSMRLNHKMHREEEILLEHPVRYNNGKQRERRSLARTNSGQSMESNQSNDLDKRRGRRSSLSMNNDTSLDTLQREEERLGTITRYTNKTPFFEDPSRNIAQITRKSIRKEVPIIIPTIFTSKPPLNEKLIKQRVANTYMDQTNKPKTYKPQRMKKQFTLLTRRPTARALRSFHQEAALLEQAQRWHRIKRMMKRNETNSQYFHYSAAKQQLPPKPPPKPESGKKRQLYDRPLQIRGIERGRHYNNHNEDMDGHEVISSRSRSGCDVQFDERQRLPLKINQKQREATPCGSACSLKGQDSGSYQRKLRKRHLAESKSLHNSFYQKEAQSSTFIDRHKQLQAASRYASSPSEEEMEEDDRNVNEGEQEQAPPAHKLTSAGYKFVKQTANGKERALKLVAGPSTIQGSYKRKLSRRDPVGALMPMNSVPDGDRSTVYRETFSYPSKQSRERSSSPADGRTPKNRESCHRKCQHSGYTDLDRPCPAQLSSILKSPSKHFKNSNEGRRVNFVGSDYQHSVNNGIYTSSYGSSSLSIQSGTRRSSVVRAHTVHNGNEPPIVSSDAHSFTFLNQENTSRAPRVKTREMKPPAPSLFAVPLTPTIDPEMYNRRSVRMKNNNDRLPFSEKQQEMEEPFDERRLPTTSQLLSKPEDFRPRRKPLDDRSMPPPVSLVSDLDFNTHYTATRVMTPGEFREEGGTGLVTAPNVITSLIDQMRLCRNTKFMRATRAAACRQVTKPTITKNTDFSLKKWMYPEVDKSGINSQHSPFDCINRAESSNYYPRRRCCLRRLPEEPLVIGPTHGALREKQLQQHCLPVLFYGRQRS